MKQNFVYIFAYLSLLICHFFLTLILLGIFNIIPNITGDISTILMLISAPFATFYQKYKPMPFAELVLKYTGISLPSWQSISHTLQRLIGTDPELLKKDPEPDKKTQTYKDYKKKDQK